MDLTELSLEVIIFKLLLHFGIPIIATVVSSQFLKRIFICFQTGKKFDFKKIGSDGDFPSSHSGLATMTLLLFWEFAITLQNVSTETKITLILIAIIASINSVIVIRDAFGLRLNVEVNRQILLKLAKQNDLLQENLRKNFENNNLTYTTGKSNDLLKTYDDSFDKKCGHYPFEVAGGIIWGIIMFILFFGIFNRILPLINSSIILASIFIIVRIKHVQKK